MKLLTIPIFGLICAWSLAASALITPSTSEQPNYGISLTETGTTNSQTAFSSSADTPNDPSSEKAAALTAKRLNEQRYHYELAKQALRKQDVEAYNKHYALLGDYPLVAYIDYVRLKKDLSLGDKSEVDKFLQSHKGAFLETRLREQWLFLLASKKAWPMYQDYYTSNLKRRELECFNLYARIDGGNNSAYDEVAEIWSAGKSHPKACDTLFKQWQIHGGLTNDVAWQRFINAMAKSNRGLARYISRLMDGQHKEDAALFFKVDSYPNYIKKHVNFARNDRRMQQIISHGIKRLARTHPKSALYHWEFYEAQRLFAEPIASDSKLYIVKKLASKGYLDEAEALVKNSPTLRQKDVLERLIREALRKQQYTKVSQWLQMLEEKERNSDRWQYWQARMQESLNINDAETSSHEIYQKLAKNRSFYGFLASDIIGSNYALEHKLANVQPSTAFIVSSMPAIKRAKELWLRGNQEEAQAEWMFATKAMNARELIAVGLLAREWGWYNKGIQAMISGNHWDYLDIRFPLAFEEEVNRAASTTALEPTLIYAIARQESAFVSTAKSSAGAMGLMQLMPSTAKQTARKSDTPFPNYDLLNPEHNIALGSRYLNELLGRFNGNRIFATAAYNAGPHRVNRWIKRNEARLPFDIWIETIPFKETRGYVQNVLSYSVIYAYRMGKTSVFITEKEASGVR